MEVSTDRELLNADLDGECSLHSALRLKDHAMVELLLKRGVRANKSEKNGIKPLDVAMEMDDTAMIQLLLLNGAHIFRYDNQVRFLRISPRSAAIKRIFGQNNANLSPISLVRTSTGQTPFHFAARHGDRELMETIISIVKKKTLEDSSQENNLTLVTLMHSPTIQGWTPLHYAAASGYPHIVTLLLEEGADSNALTSEGWSAFYIAARFGLMNTQKLVDYGAILEILLSNTIDPKSVEETVHFLQTHPLSDTFLAIINQRKKINQMSYGANFANLQLNHIFLNGWTPLHYALFNNRRDEAELLIEQGAVINPRQIWTPLLLAARQGHLDIVNFLLARGVDKKERADVFNYLYNRLSSCLILTRSLRKIYVSIMEKLAEKDLHLQGWTPLHLAALANKPEEIRAFIEMDATLNLPLPHVKTPLLLAAQEGNIEAIRAFIDFNVSRSERERAAQFVRKYMHERERFLDDESKDHYESIIELLVMQSPTNELRLIPSQSYKEHLSLAVKIRNYITYYRNVLSKNTLKSNEKLLELALSPPSTLKAPSENSYFSALNASLRERVWNYAVFALLHE